MSNEAIQTAASNAENTLRNAERDVMNERSFDVDRHAPKRTAAEAAIAALEQASADHPSIATLRQRLGEMAAKADQIVVDAFRQSVDGYQRAAARDADQLTSARTSGRPVSDLNPAVTADKQVEWVTKIRGMLDEARGRLTSERGRACTAELEAWFAATEQKVTEIRLLADAFELFRNKAEVEGYGELAFNTAMDSVERNMERDPEKVVQAWDAAKKLIDSFKNPRYAGIPEVQAAIARYTAFEQRVATELRPKLAKLRVEPLIKKATYTLDLLKRDTDNLEEDNVLKWRKQLREELVVLQRDWSDEPDAEDFLATCKRAFRRSEEDLGEKIVLREIQAAEVFVKPLVERVERGLALKSASRILEYAPRLRVRLAGLAPFLDQQRVRLLVDRAEAALARIEPELGADVARAVANAEVVPHFEIDIATDSKVQAVLKRLNRAFEQVHEEYETAQASFEEGIDLVNGSSGTYANSIANGASSASRSMIRMARSAEEIADELKKIDRKHPAVEAVLDAVPKVVKRAQVWTDRIAKKCEYAAAIESARSRFHDARQSHERAASGDPHDAKHGWPEVLQKMRYVDEFVAKAVAILPDEHEEADAWGAKAAALRAEASEKLSAACLAEATRLAIANDTHGAQQYADVLRQALPDAPENEQIAAAIAGTADVRQKAKAEIELRAALITKRAEAAAQTARPTYDAWVAERAPVVALAGTIVANIEQYKGKWIAGSCSHLGTAQSDDFDDLNGDIYLFEYDPEVRAQLQSGMKKLNELYGTMAEKVVEQAGVTGLNTTNQHYPRDAHYHCEIVGVISYTPRHEVRDSSGRVAGSVEGNPYPVPRVVIRAVATTYFIVVPGQSPNLDAMDTTDIVP